MIKLSDNATENEKYKKLFKDDSVHKRMKVYIGTLSYITNDCIEDESFCLEESFMMSDMSITGCVSAKCTVKLRSNISLDDSTLYGARVVVNIACQMPDGTYTPDFTLFYGYLDSAVKDATKTWYNITCYDGLYYKSTKAVYQWYKSYFKTKSKRKVGDFRRDLCSYVGLPYDDVILPQDNVVIKKRLKNKKMTFVDLMKDICQINGCWGKIDRDGRFTWTYVSDGSTVIGDGAYPNLIYPNMLFPNQSEIEQASGGLEIIDYYRSLVYDDFVVKPLSKGIIIRQNEDDDGVLVKDDSYKTVDWDDDTEDTYISQDEDSYYDTGAYIIQGNFIAYKLSVKKKRVMISNMIAVMGKDVVFRNYTLVCNGLPYVECGDKIVCTKADKKKIEFIVTNRKLEGIQALKDTYSFSGVQDEQVVSQGFLTGGTGITADEVTDIATGVAKSVTEDYTYSSDTIDQKIENVTVSDVLYIQSWDSSTGILRTSSTPPNSGT